MKRALLGFIGVAVMMAGGVDVQAAAGGAAGARASDQLKTQTTQGSQTKAKDATRK